MTLRFGLAARALLGFAIFVANACGSSPSATTETQIRLEADANIRASIRSYRLVITNDDNSTRIDERGDTSSSFFSGWPIRTTLLPRTSAAEKYQVVAEAYDANGQVLRRTRALSGFLAGQRAELVLWFLSDCSVQCPSEFSCGRDARGTTGCLPDERPPTPIEERVDANGVDASAADAQSDAGLDASQCGVEICGNFVDDDCNGFIDDCQIDGGTDAGRDVGIDGALCSSFENCGTNNVGNGIDDDCNGLIDDGCTSNDPFASYAETMRRLRQMECTCEQNRSSCIWSQNDPIRDACFGTVGGAQNGSSYIACATPLIENYLACRGSSCQPNTACETILDGLSNCGVAPFPEEDFASCLNGANETQCPDAEIPSGVTSFAFDLRHAGNDRQAECGRNTAGADRSFRWTPTQSGSYRVWTGETQMDTILSVYASCSATQSLACNDNRATGSFQSEVTIDVTAGQSYVVVVDGPSAPENSTGNIHFERLLVNDNACIGSTLVESNGSYSATGNIAGATNAIADCGTTGEVVFAFTPSETGIYGFLVNTTNFAPVVSIREGTCSTSSRILCSSAFAGDGLRQQLTAGQRYLVVVESDSALTGDGAFSLYAKKVPTSVTCPFYSVNTVPFFQSGQTFTSGNSFQHFTGSGIPNDGPDHSYRFTAPSDGTYTFEVESRLQNPESLADLPILIVREPTCTSTGSFLYSRSQSIAVPTATVTRTLTAGQEVIVVVDSNFARSGVTYDLAIARN